MSRDIDEKLKRIRNELNERFNRDIDSGLTLEQAIENSYELSKKFDVEHVKYIREMIKILENKEP